MKKPRTISISTYHEYILEAAGSLRRGLYCIDEVTKLPSKEGVDLYRLAHEHCRYSFLMTANSLEAAANALLRELSLGEESYGELEKLGTLSKFKLYCDLQGKKLDSGNVIYNRVRDIISCRNEFVHPKPKRVEFRYSEDVFMLADVKRSKNRNYPFYLFDLKFIHSVNAMEDALKFLSWACFDVCKMDIGSGAMMLGLESFQSNADLEAIESDLNKKGFEVTFDLRTFGAGERFKKGEL